MFNAPVTVTARPPVSWPQRIGVVPPLADCRQHRRADIELAADTPGAVCQVLTGLGGVGKTQLAAAVAHGRWERREVDLLVWVTATSRSSVIASYAQAAGDVVGDVSGVVDPDQDRAAQRFLSWLAGTDRRWLVVLDDLIDPSDLHQLWPPTATVSGRTVVTTRRDDTALTAGRQVIRVGLFVPDESVRYLSDKLADPRRLDQAAELADDLGHLPLALAQAAAYILDRDLTCAAYRTRLTDRRRRLAELVPEPSARPDDYRNAVTETWSLSIELADQLQPAGLAAPMLRLAALLDPNGIPGSLFTTPAVLSYLVFGLGREQPVPPEDGRDALRCLHRLNLATLDEDTDMLRVHNLLQRTVREDTPATGMAVLATTAALALLTIWPEIESDPEQGRVLRSNTAALQAATGPLLWTVDFGPDVLFTAGDSLGNSGQVAAAVDYFDRLHAAALEHVGPDHQHTLDARFLAARWRQRAGDPAGAATALAELLADQDRVLGRDHHDLLVTRAALTRCHGEAGNPSRAATELDTLLADLPRGHPPDYPYALGIRHDLAHWQGQAGNAASAATAYRHLLADCRRVLGPDDPQTLIVRSQLGMWLGESGNTADAITVYEELLLDAHRVLGPEHPDVLTFRDSLAFWRGQSGDVASAAIERRALLPDARRILGPDHPFTLTLRGHIAGDQARAGDVPGAAEALHELLADHLRVHGPDHPHTLATRGHIARLHGKAEKPADAATAYVRLLADQHRVLGPDHPDTLATRSYLAQSRGEAGDPTGAVTAHEQLLADRVRILGPDHPNTLATRIRLAIWRANAGDRTGALAQLQELLPDLLRVHGPNHPNTLTTRRYLDKLKMDDGGSASSIRNS